MQLQEDILSRFRDCSCAPYREKT